MLKLWTTKGLVTSIKNIHKMSKNFNLKTKYIKYRNLLTSLIIKAKKCVIKHFKKYINTTLKKYGSLNIVINEIKNNDCCILKDSIDIANEFNKYFINVGNEIENKYTKK